MATFQINYQLMAFFLNNLLTPNTANFIDLGFDLFYTDGEEGSDAFESGEEINFFLSVGEDQVPAPIAPVFYVGRVSTGGQELGLFAAQPGTLAELNALGPNNPVVLYGFVPTDLVCRPRSRWRRSAPSPCASPQER